MPKIPDSHFGATVLLFWLGFTAQAQLSDPPPALSVRAFNHQSVRLAWPRSATYFMLETTDHLGPQSLWMPVTEPPVPGVEDFSVTVTAGSGTRFFRLRQPPLTTIGQSSPADGETGVAVTRETIFRFTQPLATNTFLSPNHLYATFGGRRVLSRVEMSSDRRTVTLFYLEPLPGSARVRVTFDAFGLQDVLGRFVDLDGDGQPGGVATVDFDTLSLTPLAGTAVIGHVFASELMPGPDTGTNAVNRPLAGVTITVDGMEQTLRTRTDTNGYFRLEPVPAGQFFVHIDGRTVTNLAENIRYPDLSYYPAVGKAWTAVAGRTNNIAGFMPGSTNAASSNGWIFLPLITQGTLQPVSMTEDTTITFPPSVIASNPALAGVTITVPANSLFSDNGTRGGKVGIAPVPPDRLPGPLPPGLEFPLVITVQTDGPLNFDRPAPICFPNLRDPVLGVPLPANSKQALISFNHDKGIWEAVGSMTVSTDGKMICSDPGVGILQPGWHGVGPLPDGPPPPDDPPKCPEKDRSKCISECNRRRERCKLSALEGFMYDLTQCGKPRPPGTVCNGIHGEPLLTCPDPPSKDECQALLTKLLITLTKLCEDEFNSCVKKCDRCFPMPKSSRRSALAPGNEGDSILDQLEGILTEAAELIRPFVLTYSSVPPDIQNQVESLLLQADAVSGGNGLRHLAEQIVAFEEESATYARSIGIEPEDLNPGDAPPHPVLYVATVIRPSGLFILRGETGPFGQYSLFVPRDGDLFDVSFYDPRTKEFGLIAPNLSANAKYRLPRFTLAPLAGDASDFDRDGLPDLVEGVLGTDPTNPDSDADGIFDGAEVDQGTNPLDGVPVRTGIVGSVRTPGSAVDVAAANDLLAVAQGTSGVSVFNIFNGMNPILIVHVDTPGTAQAVAMSGNFVAVADRERGLVVIDVSEPAQARIVHQRSLSGSAQAVVTAGNRAYVGTGPTGGRPRTVAVVDLITGILLEELLLPEPLNDLAISGDHLYALTQNSLLIYGGVSRQLELRGRLAVAGQPSPLEIGRKLFGGGGLAYVGHFTGYSVISVSNSAAPVLVGSPATTQLAVHDLVTTDSGLLLATTSFSGPQTLAVSLYDASQPANVTQFLTSFDTPGDARALTIHRGLGYVADSGAGVQVINYLSHDRLGIPPTITLSTSATGGVAEAGTPLRVTALARDDVQVRNVEFYLDGVEAFSDGNFPFEYRLDPPAITAIKTNFTLRARAIDTGGNFTWSDELTIMLGSDVTPPRITSTAPLGGGKVVTSVFAYFNEPMNPATLSAASFQLISAGADGLLDTADDLPVGGGAVAYHVESFSVSLDFAGPLPDGLYRAAVTTAAADMAGNQLANNYVWQFRVADAVFWSRSSDGLWEDPSNWSTGAVPGPADDVFIESIPGDVTITHASGTSVIKSLIVRERVTIFLSTLQVADTIELHQPMALNFGTLRGGIVKQNGAGKLVFVPNAQNTLDGVSVEGDLELTSTGMRAVIRNGLSLTGSVILDNTGAITFAGDQTFNTGQVVFAGTPGVLGIEPGTTLTLGPAMVVRGKSGNIGQGVFSSFGTRKLINQGLIAADVAGGTIRINPSEFENTGTLECKNSASVILSVANAAVVEARNAGMINASGGGTLTLEGTWRNSGTITANEATVNFGGTFTLADLGTFNRTGGTVNLLLGVLDLGGGTLALNAVTGSWRMNFGTIKNGTVTQTEGAKLLFTAPNSINTFDGMHVEGDLELTVTGARALIRNGLTLAGSVILDNTGAITFAGDQTFNTGQVIFAGNSAALSIEPGTTLTLGPAMVVRGKSGFIGSGAFGTRKLINQGLISADMPGGPLNVNPTEFENSGTLRADGTGAILVIRAIPFTNTGTIEELNGGDVQINP